MILTSLTLTAALGGGSLEWFDGPLANAIGQSAQDERPVVVYFRSDQSETCGMFYEEVLLQDAVADSLGDAILFSANHNNAHGRKIFDRYPVRTMPTMLVLAPGGELHACAEAAIDDFRMAWKVVPEPEAPEDGYADDYDPDAMRAGLAADLAMYICHVEDDLRGKDKKWALELAEVGVAHASTQCESWDGECTPCDEEGVECHCMDTFVAERKSVLARAHRLNGNDEEALTIARECVALDPDNEDLHRLVSELEA